ncbi:MAG: amidohydrolase [Gammaproteobacteria bacterium]
MPDLRVTLVQSALHWHDIGANLDRFSTLLGDLRGKSDLVILPEMFTTGFTMEAAQNAETMEGSGVRWLAEQAALLGATITGSLVIEENGAFYNRLVWMRPDGSFETYDKRHLFRMAEEHHHYTPGDRRLVVELKGWRICPLVCYDLRFPVWSRNREDYDLLLYVANWPRRRRRHWNALLTARAIENLCYVAGVNRIGKDGNDIEYAGDSTVVSPQGESLAKLTGTECVLTLSLSREALTDYRKRFPAHLDADRFTILDDAG